MRYIKVEHNIIFNGNILPDQFSAPYFSFINICGHQLSWIWWKSLFQVYVKFVNNDPFNTILNCYCTAMNIHFRRFTHQRNQRKWVFNEYTWKQSIFIFPRQYTKYHQNTRKKIKHQNHSKSVLRVGTSHITLPKSYLYR